jgi:hypothetical protein
LPQFIIYVASVYYLYCLSLLSILHRFIIYIASVYYLYCLSLLSMLPPFIIYIAPVYYLYCLSLLSILPQFIIYIASVYTVFSIGLWSCWDSAHMVLHLSSPRVLSGVRVTRSLVLCACFIDRCLPLLSFSWAIVVSVLQLTDSDYPLGIFKLFLFFLFILELYVYIT